MRVYKGGLLGPREIPQSTQLSLLLPHLSGSSVMAFKALLSIVSIVAAIQGASGELVAVLSLIHVAVLSLSCSCAHPARCVPRRQEHRNERSLLRPLPNPGRHHREPLPQPVC